ncbi:MAG: UDP-glucose/GDP-mannose dehydrogenase family protein [Candidatus Thermoplasmatota archaeon]|nr:UDP-glucose/GDP-mannose dehydrogenase family protein [Candidatus Thermoplasmatota archaeon]
MRICVIGAGYVGLATGVMFGKLGHKVVCADIDARRVNAVNWGELPFYEPPLEKELRRLIRNGAMRATDDVASSVRDSGVVFICVQTPSLRSGRIDVGPVKAAAVAVGKALRGSRGYKVVVVKSTVVPSTTDSVLKPILERHSQKKSSRDFGLCMNPEFLQEGSALKDSMEPSRIVVGSEDRRAGRLLLSLYKPVNAPMISTDLRSAEMIKYASNVFLATKITYANEIANMCERFGIDSEPVLRAAGLDPRIGALFLRPGLGFGGSCLPKDVKALLDRARSEGYRSKLLSSILAVNESQPDEGIRMLEKELGDLRGKRIAVLGLAFKGGVDDVRETRAVPLITGLLARGARVVAFDPMAMENFIRIMPTIRYASSAGECLKGAEGCIVQADWPEFKKLGRKEFSKMKNRVIVDGRRFLDPEKVRRAGATYLGIGYGSRAP